MTQQAALDLGLGEKLQRMREERGLDLGGLAQRSGVAEATLGDYEAGHAVPTIGELIQIAGVLDVSLGHFFQRGLAESRVEVVRAADRWTVQPKSEAGRTLNYRYQSLSYNLTDKLMAPFLVEIPPDDRAEAPASTHQGEEFLFVLSGQLEVVVGGETHRLAPGDAIYFDSRLDHALRAVEGGAVRILACVAQERRPGLDDPMTRAYDGH